MDFFSLSHAPGDFQQSLTPDKIRVLAARTFGSTVHVRSARELAGGEYNTIYRIALAGHDPVILRAAPDAGQWVPWHEEQLMRREHTIQPYFAALGSLLPQTLFIDFTRDLIDRDYLFQTDMPGQQWSEVSQTLRAEEQTPLWRELASIAKTIHVVEGDEFGHPYPGRRFPTWSACMLDWLERAAGDIEHAGLDATESRAILDAARASHTIVDEITRPHLLHGDLWPFNVLIAPGPSGWHITAMLDYDRASWGDPFADWTFHLLPRRATPEVRATFWREYGRPEQTAHVRFRALLYEGMHAGNVLASAGHRGDDALATTARGILRGVVKQLRNPLPA
ncbi:MAG: phosphotransferase family protein [Ktedonobacterales bacterium]